MTEVDGLSPREKPPTSEVVAHLPPLRAVHVIFVLACMLTVCAVGYAQMRLVLHIVPTLPIMTTPTVLGGIVGTLLLRAWRYNKAALSLLAVAQSREREVHAANQSLADKNAQLRDARDQAVDAAEEKSQLVAHISHEIRTPLNGILGITEVLLYDESDPERSKSLRILGRSGEMLLRIANDVLDLSKANSSSFELEQVPFALVELAEVVVNLFTPQATAKGIGLHAEIDPDVPPFVSGDPVRVTQVLNNLVANAIKFTEAGSVRLQVSSAATDACDDTVRFDVADTGVGLAERDCERIFEPFVQQAASTARRFGGTGLGLAICKRLAALMDGQLVVRSELGRGSTFSLTVPMPAADRPRSLARPQTTPPRESRPPSSSAIRVLVVEDDLMIQSIYKRLLPRLGCEYHAALDGREAVHRIRSESFDVVLMDFHMPIMNGPTAAREIRKLKDGAAIPIIGLTGAASREQDACLAAGMDEVLTKPIRPVELRRVLDVWTEAAHADTPTRRRGRTNPATIPS